MQKRIRIGSSLTAIPVVALLGLTAACSSGTSLNGEEKKSPTRVVSDARTALKAAKTVHLAGTVKGTDAGPGAGPGSSFVLDMHYLNGTGGYGTVTVGGQKLDIVRVGNDVYVKGDASLTGASGGSANKFQKLSATSGTGKSIGDIADVKALADNILATGSSLQPTLAQDKIDGVRAVVLTDKASDGPGKLYVANTGAPVPLAIEGTGSSTGTLTFSDYNKNVSVTAPTDVTG